MINSVLSSSHKRGLIVVNRVKPFGKLFVTLMMAIALIIPLVGCALPQVSAEERLFLNLSLELLDVYTMPRQTFEDTPVGGLSAIAYEPSSNRLYALSDDRGNGAPPRFYTLHLELDQSDADAPHITDVAVEAVTFLTQDDGSPYPNNTIDPEGIALSPSGTLYISSEGVARDQIAPFVNEFDATTGQQISRLPIPQRYIPQPMTAESNPAAETNLTNTSASGSPLLQGVQDNRGFEALALSAAGSGAGRLEPFRIFAAIEEPLSQDLRTNNDNANGAIGTLNDQPLGEAGTTSEPSPQPGRLLHYLVGEDRATLLAEHLYPIESKALGDTNTGLVELLTLGQGGYFLSLERSFGLLGFSAKLYQMAIANATDISQMDSPININAQQPVYKQLLLDLAELDIPLDNLEGMTLGPQLADGSRSLLLVSDDNFSDDQVTQWLLFRLSGTSP